MKRCPQCEFIYNDDQSLCDMDGQALIYDAQINLPAATAAQADIAPPRSRARSILIAAISGLVLAMVAWFGYVATPFASTIDGNPLTTSKVNDETKAASIAASALYNAEAGVSAFDSSDVTEADADSAAVATNDSTVKNHSEDKRLTIQRGIPPLPRLQPLPRLSAAKPRAVTTSTKPAVKPQQKGSRVESFLKKTGRVLKKPFKF